MSKEQKEQLKNRLGFEAWRDRAFSVIIPGVLIYLLISDGHSQNLKLIALILLAGFATGQAALIVRSVANSIAEGILKSNEQPNRDNDGSDSDNGDRRGDDNA